MSYDLTRLRRKGLIQRLPRTNTDVLTSDGTRFALVSTKVHDRLLVPLLAANAPPASPSSATRFRSSTTPGATRSRQPDHDRPPETLDNPQTRNPQGTLRRFRDGARNRWPPGQRWCGPSVAVASVEER